MTKKQPSKKATSPGRKKPGRKKKNAVAPSPGDDYYVGEIEQGYHPTHVSHPSMKLATDHIDKMKSGESFAMSAKFKGSVRSYVRDAHSQRVYVIRAIEGNKDLVRVFRTV